MNEDMNPGKGQANGQKGADQNKNTLETKGPAKDKAGKVLNKDGSLADLPYNNKPGGGPNECTVGIGT